MNRMHATLIVGAWTIAGYTALLNPAQAACAAGAEPKARVKVMVGRNVGDKLGVSDEAWRRFLDRDVTPAFPRASRSTTPGANGAIAVVAALCGSPAR